MSIEKTVLANLISNDEYGRKVIPFLRAEYFSDFSERTVFDLVDEYAKKYNSFPSREALLIDLSNKEGLNQDAYQGSREIIENLEFDNNTKLEWLVDQTEKWCQDRALYLAIMQSIRIIDEKNGSISRGSIPKILSDALGVSFDTHIGHDFIADTDARYEFYHRKEKRIPFDLEYFNTITGGGLPNKTLNIALAGTGVGKSLFMCHCAAANISQGYNVLYITLEMAEERIAERIDANLLDVDIATLELIPKTNYDARILKMKNRVNGRLIIKEYPTACAGSANFRHLLSELMIKKNFIPDIIYIDYLNICVSSRLKYGTNVNSYTYIKAIAEELRGLAVEHNVPIVSATQTTRSGYSSSDVGLEDTSESFGLPATADFMFALISTEELDSLGQILVKQLKNRYNDPGSNRRFVIGIDRAKMRLYDVDESAQSGLLDGPDTKPVFDKSKFGEEELDRQFAATSKFDRSKFEGFK